MKSKLIKYDSHGNYIGEEEIEIPDTPEPTPEPTIEDRISGLETENATLKEQLELQAEALDYLLMQ